jgi:hypothetical protein
VKGTKMKVGSRVLVRQPKNMFLLGIITNIQGENNTVKLDNGSSVAVSGNKLVGFAWYEKYISKPIDKDWVETRSKSIRPDNWDTRSTFLQKKGITCTIPLLECMWTWGNKYIFESKLSLPTLATSTGTKRYSGIFKFSKDKSPSKDFLGVSKSNNYTFLEVFSTLLHEAVHQYQYRVSHMEEGTFDPNAGGHGKSFWRWKGPLKEIGGVNLTVLHDGSAINLEDVEDEGDTNRPVIFVLAVKSAMNTCYVTKSLTAGDLSEAKTAIRAKMGLSAKYYTRTLQNPALLNAITSVKSATTPSAVKLGGKYYFNQVTDSVFENILKIAKPLEK